MSSNLSNLSRRIKYKYLFKVVKKMENDKYLWPLNKKISRKIILVIKY